MSTPLVIRIRGDQNIVDQLRGSPPFYGIAAKIILEAGTKILEDETRQSAPRKTGALLASMQRKVSTSSMPKTGRVTIDATNRGFRYPYALNASPRYHYRSSGPIGAKTKDYFNDRGVLGKLDSAIDDGARAIAARWGRP